MERDGGDTDIDEKIIGRNGYIPKKIRTIEQKSPTKPMSSKDRLRPNRKYSDHRADHKVDSGVRKYEVDILEEAEK